ncbi:MAG: hydrogenase 3 maturation endopeptidase HyCI [bacterium]
MLENISSGMDESLLKRLFNARVALLCIGNELRGDDAVGPLIASMLTGGPNIKVVNCGETPENFLKDVVEFKPGRVIIVDAARFGGQPGQVRVFWRDDIASAGVSTHDAILELLIDHIENETGAEVVLLGIEIENRDIGSQMSRSVRETAKKVAKLINQIAKED